MPRNFGWWRRTSERLQDLIFQDRWPAAISATLWPPSLRIWEERLELRKPLGTAPALRIAFGTDFHAGPLTPPASIEAACDALAGAGADLILLGGDFVSLASRHARHLTAPLARLRAPLGVHAVLGNHDHWAGADAVTAALHAAGINLLTNQRLLLPAPWERTAVIGIDDHISGYPAAESVEWNPELATLLLVHQPSGLLDIGGRPFDLGFAGHTHGGQITMPGGYAPVVPEGTLSRQYLAGRYTLDHGGTFCVSVGIGNSGLPLRFGPTPEVLICDVIGANTAG